MTDNTQDIITFIREDDTLYRAMAFYLRWIMPGDPVEAVPLDWRCHENYNDPDYQKRFLAGDLVGVLATHIDRVRHCPDRIDSAWAQLVSNAVGGWVGLFDVDEPVIPFDEYLALIGDVEQLEQLEQLPEGIDVEAELDSVLERVAVIRSNAGYMKLHPSVLKSC
ncbi:hypothetical protein [Shewanella algae]|uniref:hypothetical protein n=1 Tax=Shewanella algae TaxID=38313 RepID=UPI001184219F|nr:hypothetical protein [Shewanella algae]TVL46725.1 hypothetical protein AYI98_14395 [Shewanella algae]